MYIAIMNLQNILLFSSMLSYILLHKNTNELPCCVSFNISLMYSSVHSQEPMNYSEQYLQHYLAASINTSTHHNPLAVLRRVWYGNRPPGLARQIKWRPLFPVISIQRKQRLSRCHLCIDWQAFTLPSEQSVRDLAY